MHRSWRAATVVNRIILLFFGFDLWISVGFVLDLLLLLGRVVALEVLFEDRYVVYFALVFGVQ